VNETAGGFDVWLDTAQAGTLRGSLNVKGPTGQAVITIDVDVFPPPPQTPPPPPVPEAPPPPVSSRRPTRRRRGAGILGVLWALIPVLSFGFLTPVPFAYAAVRLHDRRLWRITSAYATAWVTALAVWIAVLAASKNGVFYLLVFWLGVVATVHALVLRRHVFAAPSPSAGP
jgi:hypothetical protein